MRVWLVEVMVRYHRLALLPALVLLSMFVWGGNQPEVAGLIPPPWDKLAHLAWFAVLAGLLHVGLGLRRGVWVVVFCLGVGLWDEWRQLSLPGRAAGWDDLLFDGLGIAVGVWVGRWLGAGLRRYLGWPELRQGSPGGFYAWRTLRICHSRWTIRHWRI